MDLDIMQNMFDGGKEYNPISIPVPIQSTATNAAIAYIKIPVAMRILGAWFRAIGTTIGTGCAITINRGYVSAGDVDDMFSYGKPMTAAQLATAGVTVTPETNPELLLFSGTQTINTKHECLTHPTSYILSGRSTALRTNGALVKDDVLIVSVGAAGSNYNLYDIFIQAVAT